jgi:hypothetical protein
MLEKMNVIDKIEVAENGTVGVYTRISVIEDGKQISSTLHRHIVAPGDDYSQENDRVKAICKATHTQSVVDAYKAAFAKEV